VLSARDVIFGYTCVNDVTAAGYLFADKAFQQWTLAKGFDSFCPLGPCIDTDVDPAELRVLAIENGEIRQDYPVSDMIYSPQKIVSMISSYQTLVPGDLIVCGTSVGASPMQPGCEIQVSIPGLGTLVNHFDDHPE
jgi:2-keto-4-pentenoate hydratase/2-oxohepta-3-ene-1,7-dioic acid hydratase in catechol pathway